MAFSRSRKRDTSGWRGDIPIESSYTAGLGGQVFFKALKDRGALMGTRCHRCEQVYVPARLFCERCFAELSEPVRIKPEGILKSFSLCYVDQDGRRTTPPVAAALVQLDGASTVMLHRLLDVYEVSSALIGSRVKAVIKPKARRTGSILDIEGFRLID